MSGLSAGKSTYGDEEKRKGDTHADSETIEALLAHTIICILPPSITLKKVVMMVVVESNGLVKAAVTKGELKAIRSCNHNNTA